MYICVNASILSISSGILYGDFSTRRYNMFVQCFCLYMRGVEKVKRVSLFNCDSVVQYTTEKEKLVQYIYMYIGF